MLCLSVSVFDRRRNMAKSEKRFVRIHSDGAMSGSEIWVDTVTGVNYFYHTAGYGGGLTVLLDRDSKPVISALPIKENKD